MSQNIIINVYFENFFLNLTIQIFEFFKTQNI